MTAARPVVATIVARNYLAFARVLAKSLHAYHPRVPVFVIVIDAGDGERHDLEARVEVIPIDGLGMTNLRDVCFEHSCQELAVLLKPFLLRHLLDRGFSPAVFLDPDVLVAGDMTTVFDEAARHAVTLTPHLLHPLGGAARIDRELNILQSGTFNAGFVGISQCGTARDALTWWQDRLSAKCSHAIAEGAYYDQRWLDLLPAMFDGVGVLRDPGCNVAYWNLPERDLQESPAGLFVNGGPLRFCHFSGFDPEQRHTPSRYAGRHWDNADLPRIYTRYAQQLFAAGYRSSCPLPYRFGFFDNGVPIPPLARDLHRSLGHAAADFGDPFATGQPRSFYAWLTDCHPQALANA